MSINVHIQNIDPNWILHWIFRSWNLYIPPPGCYFHRGSDVTHLNAGPNSCEYKSPNAIIQKITPPTHETSTSTFSTSFHQNCCFQYHCRFHGSLKQRCQKRQSLHPGRHVFTCTDAGIEGNHLMLGQVHKEWMWNEYYNIHIIYIV